MWLQRKTNRITVFNLCFTRYNNTHMIHLHTFMCTDDTRISAKLFNLLQRTYKWSIFINQQSFRTNSNKHILIRKVNIENGILSNHKLSIFNLSMQYIDCWRTKKLCHKQINRIIINFLRLIHLLKHTILHYNHQITN